MKKLLALVLVLMLCLPAFAGAAGYLSSAETADRVIDFINECMTVISPENEFIEKVKDEDGEVIYATSDYGSMCSLVYAPNGTALKGVMFVSRDIAALAAMGVVLCQISDEYYGADEELAGWMGTAIAESYVNALSSGETYSVAYEVPNGGEVVVYASPDDGEVSIVLALSGGYRITIAE